MKHSISKLLQVSSILAAAQFSACGARVNFVGQSTTATASHNKDAAAKGKDATAIKSSAPIPNDPSYNPNTSLSLLEKTFDSAMPMTSASTMTLSSSTVESAIPMTSEYVDETITKYQSNRPIVTDSMIQGTSGATYTESFIQSGTKTGPLDILIVVDNSLSMAAEQANIATKLQALTTSISQSDWRIAVVTTDYRDGCQRALIKKSDTNIDAAFKAAMLPGTSGASNEQGILMSVIGLKAGYPSMVTGGGPCAPTAAWLRPNSPVAVLIVTDEDNCSVNGRDCGAMPWNTEKYLYDYLATIRRPGIDAKVYGILYHPSQTAATCSTGLNVGTQYANIITQTNGLWGSVCNADYTNILSQISQDAALMLKSQYSLQRMPDASSVKIKINGVETTTGWTVADSVLTFQTTPALNATISVAYTVGARPIHSRVKLSATPAVDTIKVTENGRVIAPNLYSFDAATNELVYRAAESSDLRIEYRQRDPQLVSSFDLGVGIKSGTLTVKINGVSSNGFTVSSNSTVLFPNPPADGATIVFSLKRFKQKNLSYPFTLPAGIVDGQYTIKNSSNGAQIAATIASGSLTLPATSHAEGQTLLVSYRQLNPTAGWTLPLSGTPEAGSLVIKAGDKTCDASTYSVTGASLKINCDTAGKDNIFVYFAYTTPSLKSVDIPEAENKPDATWTILINDKEAVDGVDFTRSGSKIQFLKDHAKSTKIKVTVSFIAD